MMGMGFFYGRLSSTGGIEIKRKGYLVVFFQIFAALFLGILFGLLYTVAWPFFLMANVAYKFNH
jgi:hypothetical protein